MKLLKILLFLVLTGCTSPAPPPSFQYTQECIKSKNILNENAEYKVALSIYEWGKRDRDAKYLHNFSWVLACVKWNNIWNRRLDINQAEITLSMWLVESNLDPHSTDNSNSIFIAQTRENYIRRLLVELNDAGYSQDYSKEMAYHDVSMQVAFGVQEFKDHLSRCNNIWDAVKSYNGKGKSAERYVRKVKAMKDIIFGD